MDYTAAQARYMKAKDKKFTVKTLFDLCCNAIIREPSLVIMAIGLPLPAHFWESCSKIIPKRSRTFDEKILDFGDESDRAMISCVATLFKKYDDLITNMLLAKIDQKRKEKSDSEAKSTK